MFRKLLAVVAFTVASAVVAAGQSSGAQIFVGYANLQSEGFPNRNQPGWLFDTDFFRDRTTLHGVNASLSGYGDSVLGFTGDFSFDRNDNSATFTGGHVSRNTDVYYFLGGPSMKWNRGSSGGVEPFIRLMGGAAHTRFKATNTLDLSGGTETTSFEVGTTDFAAGVGGGLDLKAGERTRIRLFQVDYLPVFLRDHSVDVLGANGVIQPSTLNGQRQDNFRFSVGLVF